MSPRTLLLTSSGDARWTLIAAIVLLVALAAGIESCAALRKAGIVSDSSADVLKFSHKAHMVHTPNCADCHQNKETGAIERPTHASCVACHVAAADDKPAGSACQECHHTTDPKQIHRVERPDYSKANFDHESHKEQSCAECHGNVAQSSRTSQINFPRMEDCLSCHQPGLGQVQKADCFSCHYSLNTETIPESHKSPNWNEKGHGAMSNNDPVTCARCHVQQDDCATCHAMNEPKSHTAAFRTKTHGFHSMSDPQSCEVCHTQEFCEACHRTTEPHTHTGAFKGRPWLHCATCHLPLDEGNRCSVCHQGSPHENVRAEPPPPFLVRIGDIDLSEPCLPCHPVADVPIPHPYNTMDSTECIVCHRPE